MAVKIRLSRKGRKQMPIYDIVVADARAPRDGKFIEKLGQYNPHSTPAVITLKIDRAMYWLGVGAQPTDTTRKVLSVKGVMIKRHLQIGVEKGAITQDVADARFEAWLTEKETIRNQKIAKLSSSKEAQKGAAMEAERKKKEDKFAAIQKAEQDFIAASAAAAAAPVVEEAAEEAVSVDEAVAEVATEEVVAEAEVATEEVVAEAEVAVEEVVAEAEVAAEEVVAEPEVAAEEAPATEEASDETPEATAE
jgi:small subunit ribosomal protein S16